MGKNQMHKQAQRGRHTDEDGAPAAGGDGEFGTDVRPWSPAAWLWLESDSCV